MLSDKKTLDQILKLIFDKSQDKKTQGTKDLDTYMKSNLISTEINKTINSRVQLIKSLLLDQKGAYCTQITKGEMTIFFSLFHILKNYTNWNPDIYLSIIEPLLSFLKDQDTKLIITSANTLIKLLKNNNKLFFTYFTSLFNGWIILKYHPDQDVRNSGNALDEFLKDAIGNSFQGLISSNQKCECDFTIDYLLQKLHENNHPAVQIWIVSWITFIEAIPELNMINYLTKILPELFDMLANKIKDVNQCSEQCLKKISIGIESHYDEISEANPVIINNIAEWIIKNCKISNEKVRSCSFEWWWLLLNKYLSIIKRVIQAKEQKTTNARKNPNNVNTNANNINTITNTSDNWSKLNISFNTLNNSSITKEDQNKNWMISIGWIDQEDENHKIISPTDLIKNIPIQWFNKILDVLIYNIINFSNKQIENLVLKCNAAFQGIILNIPFTTIGDNIKFWEEVLKTNLDITVKDTGIKWILDWTSKLFNRFHCKMFNNVEDFIDSLINILPENNENIFNHIWYILCEIAKFKQTYSEIMIQSIWKKLSKSRNIINSYGVNIWKILSTAIPITLVYEIFCNVLWKSKDVGFVISMINIWDVFLLIESESEKVREKLCLYPLTKNKTDRMFYEKVFTLWSFNSISTLIMCIISEYFELSFYWTLKLAEMELKQEDYIQLSQIVQLLESSLCNRIRIKLLAPFKNIYLVKTWYAILMLLPQGQAFNALSNRLKSLEIVWEWDKNEIMKRKEIDMEGEGKRDVDEFLGIFLERQGRKIGNETFSV